MIDEIHAITNENDYDKLREVYIRNNLQTYEMCILAVQQYGRTLEYVKKNLQTNF